MPFGVSSTPSNWTDFWISFWSGLWSGTVYSLFIGLLVGFFLWRISIISGERAERRQNDREISIFQNKIRYLLSSNCSIDVSSPLRNYIQSNIIAILRQVDEVPLEIWAASTKKNSNIVRGLMELRSANEHFSVDADALDACLQTTIRHLHAKSGIVAPFNDELLLKWSRARINGANPEEISPWVQISPSHDPERTMEPKYQGLISDPRFKALIEEYQIKKEKLQIAINTISTALTQ